MSKKKGAEVPWSFKQKKTKAALKVEGLASEVVGLEEQHAMWCETQFTITFQPFDESIWYMTSNKP